MTIDETIYRKMPKHLQALFRVQPNPTKSEVLAHFPDSAGSGGSVPNVKISGYGDGAVGPGSAEYLGGERTKVDCGTGSAARFFYCAKASKRDRNEGLDHMPLHEATHGKGSQGGLSVSSAHIPNANPHPTVKPTDVCRWLLRLVTPPGGNTLDMYCGSGSFGKAAMVEGFNFIGIDKDADADGNPLGYLDIARARISAAQAAAFDREMGESEL